MLAIIDHQLCTTPCLILFYLQLLLNILLQHITNYKKSMLLEWNRKGFTVTNHSKLNWYIKLFLCCQR